MGIVLRAVGAALRPIRVVAVVAALTATAASTSAVAQPAPAPIPASRALVVQPENQVPSMRLQNFGGSVYERLAIRRGLVAAGAGGTAVGGAAWAGKEISARMPTATAVTWRQVAMGGLQGAVTGAVSGCVAGAAGGLVTAGALSGVGCMAAGLGGAIVGGFFGAQGAYMNLDEEGTIKIPISDLNELVKLAGANTSVATTSGSSYAGDTLGCPVDGSTSSDTAAQRLLSTFGTNSQFVCYTHVNGVRVKRVGQILTLPYGTYGNSSSVTLRGLDGVSVVGSYTGSNGIHFPSMNGYQHSGGSVPSTVSLYKRIYQQSATTRTGIGVFVNPTNYPDSQSLVHMYKSISPPATAPAWASVLGDQISGAANNLKLSNQALAGILNHLHKQITTEGSLPAGVPRYDPNDPITLDDIQQVKNQYPSQTPTVGDLSKPFSTPGREVTGGTAAQPVSPPQDVNVVGGAGTSGGTNVSVDFGPSGDETMPAGEGTPTIDKWDQITKAVDPWRNLKVNWPDGSQCPVYPVEFSLYGKRGDFKIDAHCLLLPDGSPQDRLLGLFLIFAYTAIAVRTFLKA